MSTLNGMRCGCIVFALILDKTVLGFWNECKQVILLQLAETKLLLSVNEHYKQIKTSANIEHDKNLVSFFPNKIATF